MLDKGGLKEGKGIFVTFITFFMTPAVCQTIFYGYWSEVWKTCGVYAKGHLYLTPWLIFNLSLFARAKFTSNAGMTTLESFSKKNTSYFMTHDTGMHTCALLCTGSQWILIHEQDAPYWTLLKNWLDNGCFIVFMRSSRKKINCQNLCN